MMLLPRSKRILKSPDVAPAARSDQVPKCRIQVIAALPLRANTCRMRVGRRIGILIFDGVQKGDQLTFSVPDVMGRFEGSMRAAAIHGTWKQHDASVPLDLARVSTSR